jgi:hypothetical protein
MASNPNLADVVTYAHWLGSLSDADWQKIGPYFTSSDNPFHAAGSLADGGVGESRQKFEAILNEGEPAEETQGKPEHGTVQPAGVGSTQGETDQFIAGAGVRSVEPQYDALAREALAKADPDGTAKDFDPATVIANGLPGRNLSFVDHTGVMQALQNIRFGRATGRAIAKPIQGKPTAETGKPSGQDAPNGESAGTGPQDAPQQGENAPHDGGAPGGPAEPGYGAGNKTFTADAAQKARDRIRAKLSQLNTGFDPEMMQDGFTIAGFHIEAGVRKFRDFAKVMVADLTPAVRPYLNTFYNSVRDFHGFDNAGMDEHATVQAEHKQMMAEDGMIVVIATIDTKTNDIIGNPDLISRGFVYMKENKDLIEKTRMIAKKIVKDQAGSLPMDDDFIKNKIRNDVGQFLFTQTKRRPMVLPVVIKV